MKVDDLGGESDTTNGVVSIGTHCAADLRRTNYVSLGQKDNMSNRQY